MRWRGCRQLLDVEIVSIMVNVVVMTMVLAAILQLASISSHYGDVGNSSAHKYGENWVRHNKERGGRISIPEIF